MLERKGQSSWGQDQDDVVVIPLTTANKRVHRPAPAAPTLGERHLASGCVTARDMRSAEQEIRDLLRQRHQLQGYQEDDFWIRNLAELLQAEEESSRVLTMLLGRHRRRCRWWWAASGS